MKPGQALLLFAIAWTAPIAAAAPITWSVHNITGNVSEVSNAGVTVVAASGSDGGPTADAVDKVTVATVNGVVFTDAFTMDSPTHFDSLAARAGASISDAYYELLRYGDRQATGLATWTFNGLTPGNTYQIQVWVQDKIALAGSVGHVLNNGGTSTPVLDSPGHALIRIEASGEDSPGQYALGTFVADATSQQFQARAYKDLTTTPALGINITINAYQLRDLGSKGSDEARPAPSATAKIGDIKNIAAPESWDNDPSGIKVFILAGQSNMVGYGKTEDGGNPSWVKGSDVPKEVKGGIGCLRELAVNNSKYPEYDFTSLLVEPGKPESSGWKNRFDVKVWWRNGHTGKHGGEIRKGDLGPPFQGGNASWFGPEFGFGQVIGDHYRINDVLIIKTAWGGHSLAKDFRSPAAVEKRGGEVGDSFKEIFRQSRECLDKLGEEFPEWKGGGYQIVGFAWHQGFSDRVNSEQSAEYGDNLADFIADVRKGFGNPKLPFVIASTGMDPGGEVEKPPYKGYTEVERAQLWVSGQAKPDNVLSTDTRPFWKPAEKSPSSMGYHWNHSGYSYFMVGKALGDDMVKLLSE